MSALKHANVTVIGAVCLSGCVRVRSCVSGDRETEGSHTQPGSDNLAAGDAGASVKEVPRVLWSCIIQNERRTGYISIASDLNWYLPPKFVYLRCNYRCDFRAKTTPVALVLEKYRTMRRPLKLCIGGVLSRGERASGNATLSKRARQRNLLRTWHTKGHHPPPRLLVV